MGSCVYHVAHRGMLQSMAQTGRNVELANFTQALYDARELAMERMQSEAQEIKAEGIVGVQLQETSHGWGSHTIEFFAVGTAIVPREGYDENDRTADDGAGHELKTSFKELRLPAPPLELARGCDYAGSSSSASTCRGRMTEKWRWSSVASLVSRSRSVTASTAASTKPTRRSA